MILKKTWIELMTENNTGDYSLQNPALRTLITEVDALFTSTYNSSEGANDHRLKNLYDEIIQRYTTAISNLNYWADMPIYVSSYRFKDKTPFGELLLRLTQYLGFYKKILTDNGLARSVVTHREYSNEGEFDGTNKDVNAETPQMIITDFEDAIKHYASDIKKNTDHTESSTSGESDLTVESKSWEEEEKNLKYIFYNDLCDFIRKIPQWLYSQYALDSMPSFDIVKETFNYFKDMYERR